MKSTKLDTCEVQKTYLNSRELFQVCLRTPKEWSSFVYFVLEAMDGICFYSTLDENLGTKVRDLLVSTPIEHKTELEEIIGDLQVKIPLEVLGQEIVCDPIQK